jgi:hypothetical protein
MKLVGGGLAAAGALVAAIALAQVRAKPTPAPAPSGGDLGAFGGLSPPATLTPGRPARDSGGRCPAR